MVAEHENHASVVGQCVDWTCPAPSYMRQFRSLKEPQTTLCEMMVRREESPNNDGKLVDHQH